MNDYYKYLILHEKRFRLSERVYHKFLLDVFSAIEES